MVRYESKPQCLEQKMLSQGTGTFVDDEASVSVESFRTGLLPSASRAYRLYLEILGAQSNAMTFIRDRWL
jgi:hypothetical protein